MVIAFVVGFSEIEELPWVVLGFAVPVHRGTEFGLPEPVTCCAGARADRGTSSEAVSRYDLRRFIGILQVSDLRAVEFHEHAGRHRQHWRVAQGLALSGLTGAYSPQFYFESQAQWRLVVFNNLIFTEELAYKPHLDRAKGS